MKQKIFFFFMFFLTASVYLQAQINLLKDINPGVEGSDPGYPLSASTTHTYGNMILFVANTATSGVELWKTDGTTGGTLLLKDINAGTAGSNPSMFTNYNGQVYFIASNGGSYGIWKTDGTTAGTVLVADAGIAATISLPEVILRCVFHVYDGSLYFTQGTQLIKINVSQTTIHLANMPQGSSFAAAANKIFYQTTERSAVNSTYYLFLNALDIVTGIITPEISSVEAGLGNFPSAISVNNNFFFIRKNYVSQSVTIYSYNIASTAATLITGSYFSEIFDFKILDGILYFVGKSSLSSNTSSYKICKVVNNAVEVVYTTTDNIQLLSVINGALYFQQRLAGLPDVTLFKTNGLAGDAQAINTFGGNITELNNTNNWIYFSVTNNNLGYELWKTDGTLANTSLIQDKVTGAGSFKPNKLTPLINNGLFLIGTETATGTEPYFLPACAAAPPPVISYTANFLCAGNSSVLSVSASAALGNAAHWQWYRGSCGGEFVGEGNTITVSPLTTTTYFVSGVGGCVAGTCASVTLSVSPYAIAATAATKTQNVTNNDFLKNCEWIAAVYPSIGATQSISGTVSAEVWIEGAVPYYQLTNQPYVARHYQITPQTNNAAAVGSVKLYFSQADFNTYNSAPGNTGLLPVGPGDAAGKARLRIMRFLGSSNNGTGLMATYAATGATVVNPADNKIVWNSTLNSWEVTINVTGFGGFFAVGQAGSSGFVAGGKQSITYNEKINTEASEGSDAITVNPTPAASAVTITSASQTAAVLYNASGLAMRHLILNKGNLRLDVSGLVNGVYVLKASGAAPVKIIVQH